MGRCKRRQGRGTLVGFKPELDGITDGPDYVLYKPPSRQKRGDTISVRKNPRLNKLENWVNKHKK
jgi:hypothetical protein